MQEQMNTAMAQLSKTVGQDVPTFDEVREKIEARYAKATGMADSAKAPSRTACSRSSGYALDGSSRSSGRDPRAVGSHLRHIEPDPAEKPEP